MSRAPVGAVGIMDGETAKGRAEVGDMPTAETLGSLARKVLSSSRRAESRELVRSQAHS